MRPNFVHALLLALTVGVASAQQPANPHDAAPHAAAAAGAGLKKELFEGVTEGDFLKLGPQPKSVKITLVATFTDANYGMNFNGYSHGKAVYTIPVGWTVEVTFINPSPVPHSAIVVERDMTKKPQVGEPAFKGASVPNPVVGMSTSKATFTFTASEAGDYALACGFPTHASAGHWLALDVSASATAPSLKLGDWPAKEAK